MSMFPKSIRTVILFGLLSTGPSAFAQDIAVGGPVSGFIYDGVSHSIRPIIGIPGAAYIGAGLFAGTDFAVVAPNGKSAIFQQDGQQSLLRGLDTGSPSPLPFDQSLDGVDRIVWAPDSSRALLYASTTRKIQLVNVLPSHPHLDSPIELPADSGAVAALAISPSGQIAVTFRGSSAGLYLVSPDGSLVLLAGLDEPGPLAFTHDGRGLFALDTKSMRILEVDNVSQAPTALPFADLSDSGSQFKALAVSANGQYLYIAGAGPDCVRVFETASHAQTAEFPLDAPPTRLKNLSDSLYLLNDDFTAGTPLLLFQASPQAGTWFVPAPQED